MNSNCHLGRFDKNIIIQITMLPNTRNYVCFMFIVYPENVKWRIKRVTWFTTNEIISWILANICPFLFPAFTHAIPSSVTSFCRCFWVSSGLLPWSTGLSKLLNVLKLKLCYSVLKIQVIKILLSIQYY